jgi:hypothetical protein
MSFIDATIFFSSKINHHIIVNINYVINQIFTTKLYDWVDSLNSFSYKKHDGRDKERDHLK